MSTIKVELNAQHIFNEDDLDEGKRRKIKATYKKLLPFTLNFQEVDLLLKKIRSIRIGGQEYFIKELCYDFDTSTVIGITNIYDETRYHHKSPLAMTFDPKGWEEIKRETLSTTNIRTTPAKKRSPKAYDEDLDDDED